MAGNTVRLDVREDLRQGKEPFGKIMAAVSALADGERLELVAPFEPVPLYKVLERQGFQHETVQVNTDCWQITFYKPEA